MSGYAHNAGGQDWEFPAFLREALEGLGRMNMGGGRRGGPWGPGGPFGPGFGRGGPWSAGPKVARGDVRLGILFLLREQPMHGYQIMQEMADRSGGVWRPSSGSVYPTLQQLEDEGLIQATEATGKRVFELTDEGHEYLNGLGSPAPWEQFTSSGAGHEGLTSLRDEAFQLGAALIQIAASRDDARVEAARDIIGDAKSKVYELLSEQN